MTLFLKKMFGTCLLAILVQMTVLGQGSIPVGRASNVKGEFTKLVT